MMQRLILSVLTGVFLLGGGNVYSAELLVDKDNFKEKYTDKVEVSGAIKTGAIAISEGQSAIDALWIELPETDYNMVCVSIVSVDGRYEAQFSQEIGEGIAGKTQVIIPTQYEDVVKAYSPNALAVTAQVKPSCEESGQDILASWQEDFGGDMILLLNSEAMSDVLRLKTKDGEMQNIRCVKNNAERPVAYNKECVISDYAQYDLSKIMVVRKNFSSYLDPVSFSFGEE